MKSIISFIFLGTFFVPTFSQSTISTCGGVITTSDSTISYKLNEFVSKNERCVWTVRVPNADTYTLNIYPVVTRNKRTVTGTCFSTDIPWGHSQVYLPGILDSVGTRELYSPCHVLVITLYSGEETGIGNGFSMRITANTGSSVMPLDSRNLVVNSEEGVIQHPPAGQNQSSLYELSTFVFVPPFNIYNTKRLTLLSIIINILEGTGYYDYVEVYKLRTENPQKSWEDAQIKKVEIISGDTSEKMWTSDDVIMVIFRSDRKYGSAEITIRHSYLPLENEVRFAESIFSVQNKTHISEPVAILKQVPIAEKQHFINNSSSPIDSYFEARKEITETLQFQLSNATPLINFITIESGVRLDLGSTIPTHLRNQSESALQAISTNETVVSKRELNVEKNFTLPPCTKLEA